MPSFADSQEPVPNEVISPFVRQHIWAEPLDVAELFCVYPMFGLPGQDYLRLKVDANGDAQFDRMTEEDLLRGLEGLTPPPEPEDDGE